jgi:hypothetical protein
MGGWGSDTGTRTSFHDSRGNVTRAGGINFAYDYADQPTSISGSESGQYKIIKTLIIINRKTIFWLLVIMCVLLICLESTVRYLGIEVDDVIEVSESMDTKILPETNVF